MSSEASSRSGVASREAVGGEVCVEFAERPHVVIQNRVVDLPRAHDLGVSEIRDALLARINDEEEDTAGEALVGLARRNDPRAVDHIIRRLEDGDVGNLIVEATEALASPRCLPALYALRDDEWDRDDPRGELLAAAIEACEHRTRRET